MIEKRIRGATGYAPGKNPNSHKRNAVQQRRDRIQDQLSGLHERLSKVPGDTAKQARAYIETASDRFSGLNHKEALQYYRRARKMINHLAAGHRKSVIGKAEEVTKKSKSGYGPGKNPNSHKRSANRGFSGEKSGDAKVDAAALGQARNRLAMARKAKESGDRGRASYNVKSAREWMRVARSSGYEGITTTPGAKAHVASVKAGREKKYFRDVVNSMKNRGDVQGGNGAMELARSKASSEQRKLRRLSRMTKRDETDIFVPIVKADAKEQVVYGWASPIREMGTEIIDRQGDVIDMSEVRQAAHDFMLHKRVGGSMHKQFDVGQVVESIVFDADIQKALGIDLPYEGWFIGVKVSKKEDWDKVVSGEYTGFSIGGSGIREPIEAEIIGKARGKSGYGPGKNPNSHKRSGKAAAKAAQRGEREQKLVARNMNMAGRSKSNQIAEAGITRDHLGRAKNEMKLAREAKKNGNLGEASYHASNARYATRTARLSSTLGTRHYTEGAAAHVGAAQAKESSERFMRQARRMKEIGMTSHMRTAVAEARRDNKEYVKYRNKARVTKRGSGYAPGKHPNSHRRTGFDMARSAAATGGVRGGAVTSKPAERGVYGMGIKKDPKAKHLKAAKDWMAEARDVKSYDSDQAAYAVMQARKAVRRARGASTKTGSGKSMVAQAARRFATQSVDGR